MKNKKIEFARSEEVESREREIQLIFNIIEPDPVYQPIFTSDEATILDSTGHEKETVLSRLEFYFKFDCAEFLDIPIWQVIDQVKLRIPNWPEEWEPAQH